jgi:hypothetical protein
MKTTFTPIFTIQTGHTFFTDGDRFEMDFQILLTGEMDVRTVKLLQKGDRVSLFHDPQQSGLTGQPLKVLLGIQPKPKDLVSFYNFTNMAFPSGGPEVFFFKNTNGTTRLHTSEFATAANRVVLRPTQFVYVFDLIKTGEFVVKDGAGAEVIRTSIADANQLLLSFDTIGLYSLWEGDDLLETFFVHSDHNLWGVVEIHLDSVGDEQPIFTIDFEARKLIWKYYLINRNNIDLTDLRVDHPDPTISFTEAENETLPDGTTARVIFSDKNAPIALQSRYTHRPKLSTSKTSDIDGPLTLELPTPDYNQVRLMPDINDQVYYAPIYIYL